MNPRQPTPALDYKFTRDGQPCPFAGYTIICSIVPDTPLSQTASAFQAALRQQPWGSCFALLPPSSFHMTVMDLLCDQIRTPERWSAHLPLDASLDTLATFFLDRVPPLPPSSHRTMHFHSIFHVDHLGLLLDPADSASDNDLRAYREAVSHATGVRAPDHTSYRFHMSMAYRLFALDEHEEAALAHLCTLWHPRFQAVGSQFTLPPPILASFADLTCFVPVEK
ncbi:MAG: DUF1868 domain-containing protein [Candidatus Viridilinea halotolerans]|uniref:DUF1868 domain-containing protein n=1 Tax=Candidatus Viridilinea halotolerans TaxID=2491704 RepID=A0A426U6C9_9CHLR|nr:MAG: DUF1868 domain-containing protein [Candidatus Viridilinea halotolerans]